MPGFGEGMEVSCLSIVAILEHSQALHCRIK